MHLAQDLLHAIDKNAPAPIYRQIKAAIDAKIRQGAWPAGGKLPSENELVLHLGVSRMTVNRALRELTLEGLVTRVHGVGSFVADVPRHASLIELRDIAHESADRGHAHSTRVIALGDLVPTAEVTQQLELAEPVRQPVHYLEAVHFQDGLPIQHEARYVNPALAPGMLEQDFTRITSTAWLLASGQPDEMEHVVSATQGTPALREALGLAPEHALLQLSRRTWRAGQVVTWVTLTYPGDRYQLAARYATNTYRKIEESSP
ncbi:MAG: UTRA domain-containing protein [Pseudomonadota bacterium]